MTLNLRAFLCFGQGEAVSLSFSLLRFEQLVTPSVPAVFAEAPGEMKAARRAWTGETSSVAAARWRHLTKPSHLPKHGSFIHPHIPVDRIPS